jgi:hypothetical protein
MTALAKVTAFANPSTDLTSTDLHSGAGVELFTTSMEPVTGEMFGGEATGLFTTSMGPRSGDALSGESTGLFTTSMTPAVKA